MRDNSLSGLYGLMVSSMRRISSITAVIAALAVSASSLHNSTRTEVPIMASSREYHSANVGEAASNEAMPRTKVVINRKEYIVLARRLTRKSLDCPDRL
jgi:hypothetical protein